MRGSVFITPRGLVPAVLALSRPTTLARTRASAGISDAAAARLGKRIESLLSAGPLSAKAIRAALGSDAPTGPALTILLRELAHRGRIVAARPVGGDRATAYEHALMSEWAPLVGPIPDTVDALRVMAPIWMQANGPGTVDDLAWWAGVTQAQARGSLDAVEAREVEVAGLDGKLFASDQIIAELEAVDDEPVRDDEVRLLPVWDAWLMARRDRQRILDERSKPLVVDRNGNVTNTIVATGRVVGTWDVEGERLLVAQFEERAPRLIESAAERLRPIVEWQSIEFVRHARPLDEGGQNAFRAPLRRL